MNSVMKGRPTLDITTRAAKVEIRRRRPQFRVRHSKPKMTVHKKAPTFKRRHIVTQRGKKAPIVQLSRRFVRTPVVHLSKVAKILSYDNDNHVTMEDSNNLIASMMEEPIETVIPEEETNTITDEIIQLEWDKGYHEIVWSPDELEIEWDIDMFPEVIVEPHTVEIQVRNYDGSVRSKLDRKILAKTVGIKVDKKV